MTTLARRERFLLADALAAAGPDAPTLCEGWTTADLAAHVVVRDRRPDSAPGAVLPALSGWTERIRTAERARPYGAVVARVRQGPPSWFPTSWPAVDQAVNAVEFFVHLEDVRRAGPDWGPRAPDVERTAVLRSLLRRSAPLMYREEPQRIRLAADGGPELIVGRGLFGGGGDPTVTISGPVEELVLHAFGRRDHALVEIDGDLDLPGDLGPGS